MARTRPLIAVGALAAVLLTAGPTVADADAATPVTATRTAATTHRAASRDAQVLALVNRARAHARSCGGQHYGAVPPLHANAKLGRAASRFARQLGKRAFFDHVGPDGRDPGDRITAAGYHWRSYGENIAAGYPTPQAVVKGWLASPGHCANIMTAFRDGGIGYAKVPGSPYGVYWVTDFASPSR